MPNDTTRRDWMKLMSIGGITFASGLAGCALTRPGLEGSGQPSRARSPDDDFFFLQISDTHWGYRGPANPEADVTLPRMVETINAVAQRPDFIVFTGDLTHTTDDGVVRRGRMAEFKRIVSGLQVKEVHFLPGEHDAAPDRGQAFREHFGETHYSFDHKGVHFVALDNVSDPAGAVGEEQLAWLERDLAQVDADRRVVVFAHRPLFDLYPSWDWTTQDGARVIAVLERHPAVTVFYGHIHQEHHHTTGRIQHHAARSTIFPLPAPGSVPKRAPVPWDQARPLAGLGYRSVRAESKGEPRLEERSLERRS